MFEQILPHQIILLWMTISALTGVTVALLISEGKNWLYLLANLFFAGFVGTIFGGIFVALSEALIWELWSMMIPIFIGGIVAYLVSAYLKDDIPMPSLHIKPFVMILAIALILGMSIASIYPVLPDTSSTPVTSAVIPTALNIGDGFSMVSPTGGTFTYDLEDVTEKNFDITGTKFTQLLQTPLYPLDIDSYHTSINFPTSIAEDPSEGDYMSFKFTFSVSSSSPVNWQQPVWFIFAWGDVDGDGVQDSTDVLLSEQFFKIPSTAGNIWTSCPCVYDSSGNPMWAMYGVNTGSGYQLLPVTFATWDTNHWKTDSQYTFANTPEGYTPPYDMASWQIDASNNLAPVEDIDTWVPMNKGSSRDIQGKFYCPDGMTDYTNDWYISVIALDFAYSTTEAIATHNMHFTVGGGAPPNPPIVNISSSYWVEVAMLGMFGVACVLAVKYGKKSWLG